MTDAQRHKRGRKRERRERWISGKILADISAVIAEIDENDQRWNFELLQSD